jgi:hypothetical protein
MANNYNREEERKPNKRKIIDNIQKNTNKNETPKSSQLSSYSINSLDDKSDSGIIMSLMIDRFENFWTKNNATTTKLFEIFQKINIKCSTSCASESAFSIGCKLKIEN